MKSWMTVGVLLLAASAYGQAGKPCEELKGEIAKKIEANGVKTYALDVVLADKVKDGEGKVVGSCEGGSKRIVYSRTANTASKPAAAATTADAKKQ